MTDLVKAINNSNDEVLSRGLGKITRQRLRGRKKKNVKGKTFISESAAAMKNVEMGGSSKIRNLEVNTDFNLL